MFDVCADPSTLTEFFWVICYLTTAKHFAFYVSFLVVLVLLAIAAPLSLLFGFIATIGTRSSNWLIQIFSKHSASRLQYSQNFGHLRSLDIKVHVYFCISLNF